MQIIKDCTLDCTRSNNFKTYIAKQNDTNSRFIRATLTDNGNKISVEDGNVVVIGVKRSDNEIKTFQGSVEDGDVLLPIPNWALEKAGYIECDVAVLNSVTQEKLSTTRFSLVVENNLADGDDIAQDKNYDFLLQLITDVDTAVKSCNTAADKANNIYNTVEEKLSSGKLKGDKGDKGERGFPGLVQDVQDAKGGTFCGDAVSGIAVIPYGSTSARGIVGTSVGSGIEIDNNGSMRVIYNVPDLTSTTDDIKVEKQAGGFIKGDGYCKLTFNADRYTTKSELANYYNKSEVDTELAKKQGTLTAGAGVTITDNNVISAVAKLSITILSEEPSQETIKDYDDGVLYLYSPRQTPDDNIYDEYIIVERDLSIPDYGFWEKIGTTEVDLSDYAKKTDLPTATSQLTNDSNYISDENYTHTDNNYTTAEKDKLSGLSNYDDTAVKALIAAKQDSLTATQLSNISAVPNKQDKLTTEQLNNISAVTSKQDKLTDTQLANIEAVTSKQDKLTSAQLANIEAVTSKQDKLTAGANIKIENNVISLDIETATASTTYGGDTQ